MTPYDALRAAAGPALQAWLETSRERVGSLLVVATRPQPQLRDYAKSTTTPPGKRVVLPIIGTLWTEAPDSDDAFPPAVASYEARDGYLYYRARNGAEGILVGTPQEVARWMRDVDDWLRRQPLAQEEPWSEDKHGGAEHVRAGIEAARNTFARFGLPLGEVRVRVSTDPAAASNPLHPSGIVLVNVHNGSTDTFLGPDGDYSVRVSRAEKVGAHEAAHIGYSVRNAEARAVTSLLAERERAKKPYLSLYHAFAGHMEGTAEAGAFYMLRPDTLRAVAPDVYAAVARWFDPRR